MLESKRFAGTMLLSLLAVTAACAVPSGGGEGSASEPVASSHQALTHDWSASFGIYGSYLLPNNVTVDGSGNAVTVGSYYGSADFGGSTLSTSVEAGYVAAFSSAGSHLWSKSFDAAPIWGVAADSSGNVIIAGRMDDDVDFGGGTVTKSSSTGSSLFVAKFDSSGNHVWSQSFGDGLFARGHAVAVDSSDNVIVAGTFYGDLAIGSDSTSTSGTSGFLAKFSSSGTPVFARFFEPSSTSLIVDSGGVAVDLADDSIVIAGSFASSVDFGNGVLTSNTGGTEYDAFVAKFDSSGTALWSNAYGSGDTTSYDVAVDSSGDIVVSGVFDGTVDFGSNTSTLTHSGSYGIFVAKLDGNGTDVWSKGFSDVSSFYHGLTVNSSDDVLLTGGLTNSVNFGGSTLISAGYTDVYVAQWDATGAHVASTSYGAGASEIGGFLAADSSDNVVLVGIFDGAVDLGGGWLTRASDDYDLFIAHLSP
ncbi:hypothetical protein WMF30_50105 [Sorangium sp. So ce134]